MEGEAARRFIEDAWEPLERRKYPHLTTAAVLRTPPDEQGRQGLAYDPDIYDKPMFIHPPLYPYSLALFRTVLGSRQGVLLSALCHCLTILLVALLGRMLASGAVGLIAGGPVAVEAISWICGERLWIDGMLEAAVAGAMLAACRWPRRFFSTARFRWRGFAAITGCGCRLSGRAGSSSRSLSWVPAVWDSNYATWRPRCRGYVCWQRSG